MTVGEKIRYYRKKGNLSQEDLASKLLISRQTVSLWESGQTLPTVDNLIRLKQIFGVSVDDIICEDNPLCEPPNTLPSEKEAIIETPKPPINKTLFSLILVSTILCLVAAIVLLWQKDIGAWRYVITQASAIITIFWITAAVTVFIPSLRRISSGSSHFANKRPMTAVVIAVSLLPVLTLPIISFLFVDLRIFSPENAVLYSSLISIIFPSAALSVALIMNRSVIIKKATVISLTSLAVILTISISIAVLNTVEPQSHAKKYASTELPEATELFTKRTEAYSDNTYIYYVSELCYIGKEKQAIEQLLTEKGALPIADVPDSVISLCSPEQIHLGADKILLLNTQGEFNLTDEKGYHRYMIMTYLEDEGILRLCKIGVIK